MLGEHVRQAKSFRHLGDFLPCVGAEDQILPCFLVDEVAIPAAVAKLREAILLIREPWPEAPSPAPSELAGMEGLHTESRSY